MREVNARFRALVMGPSSEVRIAVEIVFASGNTVWLVSHSDVVPGSGTVLPARIRDVTGFSQRLAPDEGRSEIGTITIVAVDVRRSITDHVAAVLVASNLSPFEKVVRVYLGAADLAFGDYELQATQILQTVDTSDDGTLYTIRCADIERYLRTSILGPKTATLTSSIDATTTTIPVTDTAWAGVDHGASFTDAPNTTGVVYIAIDDEIIRCNVASRTGSTWTNVTRGVLGTLPAEHTTEAGAGTRPDDGTTVTEVSYLELPAPMMALSILYGRLDVAGTKFTPDHWHAGIPSTFIDADSFINAGPDLLDTTDLAEGAPLRFVDIGDTDAKQFVEREVLRVCGLYMIVRADGTLALRRIRAIVDGAAADAKIVRRDILSPFSVSIDGTRIVNSLDVRWNQQGDELTRRLPIVLQSSIDRHGARPARVIEAAGIHGSRHSRDMVVDFVARYLDRYGGPLFATSLDLTIRHAAIEVGDVVRLVSTDARDPTRDPRRSFTTADNLIGNPVFAGASMADYGAAVTRVTASAEGVTAIGYSGHVGRLVDSGAPPAAGAVVLVATGLDAAISVGDRYTAALMVWSNDSNPTGLQFDGGHGAIVIPAATNGWRIVEVSDVVPSGGSMELAITRDPGSVAYDDNVYIAAALVVPGDATLLGVDRALEVVQIEHRWLDRRIRLHLNGSTEPGADIPSLATSTALPDGYYTAAGTDISGLAGVTDEGDYYEIGADLTLAGSATLTASASTFYADKDLTLPAGVTLTITGNVQIRCLGVFTVNGTIDGIGGGPVGVADTVSVASIPQYPNTEGPIAFAIQLGTPAGFGTTHADGGLIERYDQENVGTGLFGVVQSLEAPLTRGRFDALPRFNLRTSGGSLLGMPTDLRGTSGGPGGLRWYGEHDDGEVDVNRGGTGGDGGAGLAVIARGIAFGASAIVDTSGTDGAAGGYNPADETPAFAGGGAGGAPGAQLYIVDGALNPVPGNAAAVARARYGITPVPPEGTFQRLQRPLYEKLKLFIGQDVPADRLSFFDSVVSGVDARYAAARVQVIAGDYTPAATIDYSIAAPGIAETITVEAGVRRNVVTAYTPIRGAGLNARPVMEVYAAVEPDLNFVDASLVGRLETYTWESRWRADFRHHDVAEGATYRYFVGFRNAGGAGGVFPASGAGVSAPVAIDQINAIATGGANIITSRPRFWATAAIMDPVKSTRLIVYAITVRPSTTVEIELIRSVQCVVVFGEVPNLSWVQSDADPNAYYYCNLFTDDGVATPLDPGFPSEPDFVYIDAGAYDTGYAGQPRGTIGALADGEWAWGDIDSLGFDTIYLRMTVLPHHWCKAAWTIGGPFDLSAGLSEQAYTFTVQDTEDDFGALEDLRYTLRADDVIGPVWIGVQENKKT